jgi:predicted transcriptional regulator
MKKSTPNELSAIVAKLLKLGLIEKTTNGYEGTELGKKYIAELEVLEQFTWRERNNKQ